MTTVEAQDSFKRAPTLRPRRLLGRDQEITEVTESVRTCPVTTLIGPGGVGKTALATTVAAMVSHEEFADGVAVVWLAPLRSADLLVSEVAAATGLAKLGGLSYEDALTRWLLDKDMLLVLDNCEHIVSAVADLVDSLTSQLPRFRILATSREPLWVDGEVCHRLLPLPVAGLQASLEEIGASPAVQLFRERVGARQEESLKSPNACRLIGDICRRVDGLPLAIELAAARATALNLEDITSHLDELFNLLPRPARRADGGQRSLRATVEWSDALLTEEERGLLHRMAIFAGGFDLAAINGVCATKGQSAAQVADLTARLVEKSLLMKLGDSGGYQLLETIRQYSIDQLTTFGELDAVRDRHARFYLGVALQACVGLVSGPERAHLDALARIGDNLRVALERLLPIEPWAALELAASLTQFWWIRGRLREGIGWLERALAAAPNAPTELRATAYFGYGFLMAHDTDDWVAAARLLDIGIDLLADAGEPPIILGMLLCLRGECDVFNGDAKSGVLRTEAGIKIVRQYPDALGGWPETFCLWNVSNAMRGAGDANAALALFTQCAEMSRRFGSFIGEMCTRNVLGEIWEERGDLDTALSQWERAYECRIQIDAVNVGYVHGSTPINLLAIARVTAKQGDLVTASKLLREALPIAQEIRDEKTARQITDLLKQTSRTEPTQSATLRPEGGVWHIEFNGTSVHVPDFKGLRHLRELVSRPREPVPALSLIAAQSEEPLAVGDAGPQLDREALRQYRRRLAELDEQIEEAEAHNDVAQHAKRSAEREAIVGELARATGLGGKPRRTGSPTEKARLNVTRTIRHAIAYLSNTVPELASHLDESLVTGVSCCYEPRVNVSWQI